MYVGKSTIETEEGPQEVDAVYVGDFMINKEYGRQVLESSDEKTGMSGEPSEAGGLYLWAGYTDDNNYVLAVNGGDVYVRHNGTGTPYAVADNIERLWAECSRLQDEIDSIDDGSDA